MLSRRAFSTALLTALAAPLVGRAAAQTASEIGSLAGDLPQLHAIMVQRGEDIVLAEAFRGPGLDRAANIKSCSKSIVALLAGSVIARGAIESVDATRCARGRDPDDCQDRIASRRVLRSKIHRACGHPAACRRPPGILGIHPHQSPVLRLSA